MYTTACKMLCLCVVLAFVMAAPAVALAQPADDTYIKYTHGQSIVPVFEGWDRNADGSFNMVFGYLNRNYVAQMSVPVGAGNSIQPEGPDRGQPTFFYPRLNRYLFKVRVPADWPKTKELVWTINVNGKTETARATLQDVWEIDRLVEVSNLGVSGGTAVNQKLLRENREPAVTTAGAASAKVGVPLALSADVADDGLPGEVKPSPPRVVEPTLRGAQPSPVNVPLPVPPRAPAGLALMWIVYRGPAPVTFSPREFLKLPDPKAGKATATAVFSRPGEYALRAVASDGMLRSPAELRVQVVGADSQSQQ